MRTEFAGARLPTWLVAPDSFKGTFTAEEVAVELVQGLREAGHGADACPLADGGEGIAAVLLRARGGRMLRAEAHDPLGRRIEAAFALLDDGSTAVVETAAASGLCLVPEAERDAEAASSAGTGELIAAAVAAGAGTVLLGVGGSATTDGGTGAIEAIEQAGGLGGARIEVLCDTTVPFDRAAAVFGPQKGADGDGVRRLERRLRLRAAELDRDPTGVPMTGAAGGLAGGLWATFDAHLRPGAETVLDAVGFDARVLAADFVLTGEGRLDDQSLEGKLVGEVARRSASLGTPVHAVAGEVALSGEVLQELGLVSALEAGDRDAFRAAGRTIASRVG